MRLIERLPVILNIFKDDEIKLKFLYYQYGVSEDSSNSVKKLIEERVQQMLSNWKDREDTLWEEWLMRQDQRLIQLLVNLDVTGHFPHDYQCEESDWLLEHDLVQYRDILFWGQNFDENDVQLPETKYVLIKDMELDHVKAILKANKDRGIPVSGTLLKVFNNELDRRELLSEEE